MELESVIWIFRLKDRIEAGQQMKVRRTLSSVASLNRFPVLKQKILISL